MRIFVLLIASIMFFFFNPSKNTTPILGCFESRSISYRTFKKIMHIPQIYIPLSAFYKFPKGEWYINPNTNLFEILILIHTAKPIETIKKITIIEGMNSKQVLEQINNSPFLIGDDITQLEEAEIFPDTYHFKSGATKQQVLNMMRRHMNKITEKLWQTRRPDFPLSKEEWLILASIVQKEGKYKNDMEKIASCFLLRLKKKMRLQSDACVLYGLGIEKRTKVYHKELLIMTDYNTYRFAHLPKTPISMPGLDALESSLHAHIDGASLYFYTHHWLDKHGKLHYKILFAKTLDEHIKNKWYCRKHLRNAS